jgi:hypothetical protein
MMVVNLVFFFINNKTSMGETPREETEERRGANRVRSVEGSNEKEGEDKEEEDADDEEEEDDEEEVDDEENDESEEV